MSGITIVPPDGDPIAFRASESPVVRVGLTEDGVWWVITDPFEDWHLEPGAEQWKRVYQAAPEMPHLPAQGGAGVDGP